MAKGFIERTRKVFGTRGDELPGSKYRKKEADELFEKELEEYEKSREPKTIGKAPINKLKSVRRASSPSQEASERLDVKMPSRRASSPSQEALERSDVKMPSRRASSPSQEASERSDVKMPSRRASSPSQEALERSEVKAPEKTREKFLGLFEIDEKQPDFMKEMMSVNKSGGHIKKYNMGGSVRGCGKAMRGYGRANYSKKNI